MMNRTAVYGQNGWWVAAILGALGGCVVDGVPPPEQEVAVGEIGTGGPCPDQGCGENSPVIDALGFHDLSLLGLVNKQGFFIHPAKAPSKIVKSNVSYDLNVKDNQITASQNGVTILQGRALEGATITVQRLSAIYTLRIREVRKMQYFLAPLDPVETYRLEWAKVGDDNFKNLCGGIQLLIDEGLGGGNGKVRSPELMNMEIWEAVVFEGDRIDTATKTMSKTATDSWFNIGCATSTPAKLLLTHHTIHSQVLPMARAWEQRQAQLKLWVADYCGTGTSFTVARQKLVWKSAAVPYHSPPWKLEARWNENGAMCLNNPRMLYPSTPLGRVYFPNIGAALATANCSPPSCTNLDPNDLERADRISSNPVP
jgi:hypothetical protein